MPAVGLTEYFAFFVAYSFVDLLPENESQTKERETDFLHDPMVAIFRQYFYNLIRMTWEVYRDEWQHIRQSVFAFVAFLLVAQW